MNSLHLFALILFGLLGLCLVALFIYAYWQYAQAKHAYQEHLRRQKIEKQVQQWNEHKRLTDLKFAAMLALIDVLRQAAIHELTKGKPQK